MAKSVARQQDDAHAQGVGEAAGGLHILTQPQRGAARDVQGSEPHLHPQICTEPAEAALAGSCRHLERMSLAGLASFARFWMTATMQGLSAWGPASQGSSGTSVRSLSIGCSRACFIVFDRRQQARSGETAGWCLAAWTRSRGQIEMRQPLPARLPAQQNMWILRILAAWNDQKHAKQAHRHMALADKPHRKASTGLSPATPPAEAPSNDLIKAGRPAPRDAPQARHATPAAGPTRNSTYAGLLGSLANLLEVSEHRPARLLPMTPQSTPTSHWREPRLHAGVWRVRPAGPGSRRGAARRPACLGLPRTPG